MTFWHKFSAYYTYIYKKEKEEGKGKFAHKYMCIPEDRTKASFTVNLYLGYVNENTREKFRTYTCHTWECVASMYLCTVFLASNLISSHILVHHFNCEPFLRYFTLAVVPLCKNIYRARAMGHDVLHTHMRWKAFRANLPK